MWSTQMHICKFKWKGFRSHQYFFLVFEELVMSFDSSALVHSPINDIFGYLEPDTVVTWHYLKHTEAVCGSGFEAYTAVTNLTSGPCWYLNTHHAQLSSLPSSCLSLRSLMYGRCTRSVAGSSSLLVTVSGNSMKISSTDLLSEQHTLPFPTITCPRQSTFPLLSFRPFTLLSEEPTGSFTLLHLPVQEELQYISSLLHRPPP